MFLLLLLLPLLAAEPLSSPDTRNICKGKEEWKPFRDGNFYKRCSFGELGMTSVQIVGCRSVSNDMMVPEYKQRKIENGLIIESCTKVGNEVIYDVEMVKKTTDFTTASPETVTTYTKDQLLKDCNWERAKKTFSVDGIFYNCREHYGTPLPIGCTPVMSLEKTYNSFLPFGREITIAGIKQRCDLFPNRTAQITLKNPHPESIDFNRTVQHPKILGESCYFNGREVPRGSAVRIGKVTIACAKRDDRSELRFIGCYDEPLHFDTQKDQKYPEWLMVANCEKPGVVNPNEPSAFEYYTL